MRAYGVGKDTDFKQLGKGDVILLVNGDLEESAPVWFLRLRQAIVERGARLVMANMRSTKMHRYAAQIYNYDIGCGGRWAVDNAASLSEELKGARNLLIVFGDEQLSIEGARALTRALANVLINSGHAGKANSGLLPLYPHANTQGVFDMVRPSSAVSDSTEALWLVGVGDATSIPQAGFTVAQELFMTELAARADVVLPAISFAEREGTFTSGDRRVQRFYRAIAPLGQAKPDWWIIQEVAKRLGISCGYQGAGQIFAEMALRNPYYTGLTYESLSKVEAQWPPMGRGDLYYGGTVYDNSGGIGARYAADAEREGYAIGAEPVTAPEPNIGALQRLPRMLYQDGELIRRSQALAAHVVYSETQMAQAAR